MRSLFKAVFCCAAGFATLTPLLLNRGLLAEEGMYPISELKRLDLASRGIELSAEEIFSEQGPSLVTGVCRVNGCTGSFVSPRGLIITNHHCAYGAIQKSSSPDRDLLADGFSAATLDEEIPAVGYTVRVTESFQDVSSKVLSAIAPQMDFLQSKKAIERRMKELELTAEQEHPGLRAEVAEMFTGRTYVLFLYTYLKDIRLVFAPPQAVGNFGGEVDNWMWPRHTGDFSFMRAYTAPDGSAAAYAPENIPYQPKRHVEVEPNGVQEEDTVFLLGYPGRTARHNSASYLAYQRDVYLPEVVQWYNWLLDTMEAAGQDDQAAKIKLASRMRSLANVEKRSRGQLKGLHGAQLVESRQQREAALQEFINQDAGRQAEYGDLIDQIDAVYREQAKRFEPDFYLTQLRTAPLALRSAHFVLDAAAERSKPDLQRESEYMDRNFDLSVRRLTNSLTDYDAETDHKIFHEIVQRLVLLRKQLPRAMQPIVEDLQVVAGRSLEEFERTKLSTPAAVSDLLSQAPGELASSDDFALKVMKALLPLYEAMREESKQRSGQLERLYGKLIEVKREFLAQQFVPDANGTLRMTCGYIRRYSPEDAIVKLPITTLSGVIDKTTGTAPFVTPSAVSEAYAAKRFGRFFNQRLKDVPVGILYNTDTTGGNSGSPIFNGSGKLVGVNFDRCFEATINDFAWDESYSRSIGVDIRYVLWITSVVYHADRLLQEMGVE